MVDGKGKRPATSGELSELGPGRPRGPGRIICFGGAAVDRKYTAHDAIRTGTSNPASGSSDFGGVAQNVAANLARLGVGTSLVSVVGDDSHGRSLIRHLGDLGIDAEGVRLVPECRTAEYVALLHPDRSLAVGMADMAIFDLLVLDDLSRALSRLGPADWIFADGNLPAKVLATLIEGTIRGSAKLAIDPVSAPKAERLPPNLSGIDLLFLNFDEAAAVLRVPVAGLSPESAVRQLRIRGAGEIALFLGARGLVVCDASDDVSYLASVPANVVDVTGAGDAAIAATLAWRLGGATSIAAARTGTLAAALTIEQEGSAHPGLSQELLAATADRLSRTVEAEVARGTR